MSGDRPQTRPRLTVTCVRYATDDDLPRLAGIEAAADGLVTSLLDVPTGPAPTSGQSRAAVPGWVLTVGQPVVGFAHVIDLRSVGSTGWHLDQLSVHPTLARRGIGRMLLRAAMGVVLDRGGLELTLMSCAEVPWIGQWYAREGFVEVGAQDGSEAWRRLAPLRAAQERDGRLQGGRRPGMVTRLVDAPTPSPAVSVIPVRSRAGVLEVFVQHRALTMDFAPGAVVFPGGRVDLVDHAVADARGVSVARACAVREVHEETGAVIDPMALVPWDRWITPIGYPRRFDVEFFVLPVTGGEEFRHVTSEAVDSTWTPVAELVSAAERGTLTLVPPTRTIVDELSALATLDAVTALRPVVEPVRHDLAGRRPRV